MPNWEQFRIGPVDGPRGLHVTLNRKGQFMIGAAAFAQMRRPERVILLYDRVERLIGIQPSNNRLATNSWPLVAQMKGAPRVLRAKLFCRHYDIRVERTAAFNNPTINAEGTLVLDLRSITYIGRSYEKAAGK